MLLMAYQPPDSRGGSTPQGTDALGSGAVAESGRAPATASPVAGTRHANPVAGIEPASIEHARTHAAPSPWVRALLTRWSTARATWYGPGFYGKTTACGQRYSIRIRGVAVPSGGRYHLRCGHRLTICFRERRRCVRVVVIDTGSFRDHRFDLSARSSMDLCRCWRPFTMRVHWHHGWKVRP